MPTWLLMIFLEIINFKLYEMVAKQLVKRSLENLHLKKFIKEE